MTDSKDTSGIRVVVYGTLKKGHGNHRYYLEDNPNVEYLGRCLVEGPYVMKTAGFFPMVYKTDDQPEDYSVILGEVYRVDHETLDCLDLLEGHPQWYKREQVDTPFKKAWMYFMQGDEDNHLQRTVQSGCWEMTREEAEWMHGYGQTG